MDGGESVCVTQWTLCARFLYSCTVHPARGWCKKHTNGCLARLYLSDDCRVSASLFIRICTRQKRVKCPRWKIFKSAQLSHYTKVKPFQWQRPWNVSSIDVFNSDSNLSSLFFKRMIGFGSKQQDYTIKMHVKIKTTNHIQVNAWSGVSRIRVKKFPFNFLVTFPVNCRHEQFDGIQNSIPMQC